MPRLLYAALSTAVVLGGCSRTELPPPFGIDSVSVQPDPLVGGLDGADLQVTVGNRTGGDVVIVGVDAQLTRSAGDGWAAQSSASVTSVRRGASHVLSVGMAFLPALQTGETVRVTLYVAARPAAGGERLFTDTAEWSWTVADPSAGPNDCNGPCPWGSVGSSEIGPAGTTIEWGSASGSGISRSGGMAAFPMVAFDGTGAPVVAYHDSGFGNYEIYVRRHDGTAWTSLDGGADERGVSATNPSSCHPAFGIDPMGRPVVAWEEKLAQDQIFLLRFENGAWSELAGSGSDRGLSDNTFSSSRASLAFDVNGEPVVAWHTDLDPAGATTDWQIYLRTFDGVSWVELGGSASGQGLSNTTGASTDPVIVVDGGGAPVVTWEADVAGVLEVYVRRFNGAQWEELAGSASADGMSGSPGQASQQPSMTVDAGGAPVVAWTEATAGSNEIYARRWDGMTWAEVAGSASAGGISANSTSSSQPFITTTPTGELAVAWVEDTNGAGTQILVKRRAGTGWADLAGSGTDPGISRTAFDSLEPSVAFDVSGNAVVAWQDNTGQNAQVFLRHWDGVDWRELNPRTAAAGTGASDTPGVSRNAAIALGPNGELTIAWADYSSSSSSDIYARSFDGTAWVELAGSATGAGMSSHGSHGQAPVVAFTSGAEPIVAWRQYDVMYQPYVRRFSGGAWQEMAGSGSGSGINSTGIPVAHPDMALDGADRPMVAWQTDVSLTERIYFMRYDGTAWTQLGGSATGDGIGSAEPGFNPAVTTDAAGQPVVAWRQMAGGVWQIYAKAWNGQAWVELGGSASGPGLSNTNGESRYVDLATDSAGRIGAAWRDASSGNYEIYFRRYNAGQWEALGGSSTGEGVSGTLGVSTIPALAFDDEDRPVIAWQQERNSPPRASTVYLRRWSGTAWEELDGSASGGGISNSSATAHDPVVAAGASVCVAWSEAAGYTSQIVVRCRDN